MGKKRLEEIETTQQPNSYCLNSHSYHIPKHNSVIKNSNNQHESLRHKK